MTQAGLDRKTIQATVALRPRISPKEEMESLEHLNVAAITFEDPNLPPLVREIYDVPPVLYVRGQFLPQDHLTREPVHIDELCQRTHLPMPALNSTLALLELSGMTRQVGAMHFVLGREAQAEYRMGTE